MDLTASMASHAKDTKRANLPPRHPRMPMFVLRFCAHRWSKLTSGRKQSFHRRLLMTKIKKLQIRKKHNISTNPTNSAKTSITNQPDLACFSSAYGWHSICIQNRIKAGTYLSAGGDANDLQIRDTYKLENTNESLRDTLQSSGILHTDLANLAIEAHGGLERWKAVRVSDNSVVQAVSSGA
jgi:hypothetical protein